MQTHSNPQDHQHTEFPQALSAPMQSGGLPSDPYVFDMTDDQIIEAINNASASQELFQLDETMFLDWLDWPNLT